MSNWRVTVSLQCQTGALQSLYNVKLARYGLLQFQIIAIGTTVFAFRPQSPPEPDLLQYLIKNLNSACGVLQLREGRPVPAGPSSTIDQFKTSSETQTYE